MELEQEYFLGLIAKAHREKGYQSSIPIDAESKTDEVDDNKVPSTTYYRDGISVGRRIYHENGLLFWEYGLHDSRYHGGYYYFNENGELQYQCSYENGKPVGLASQWSEVGELVCLSLYDDGIGVDLWCTLDHDHKYTLSEERHLIDGLQNGVTRWWDTSTTVHRECHYRSSYPHGILRVWEDGQLASDFPKYFVDGNEVSASDYKKACITDKDLPEYLETDDNPERPANEFYSKLTQYLPYYK